LSGVTTLDVSEAYTGIGAVQADDYLGYQTLASFKPLYGFADVPEGAARARLFLYLNRGAVSSATSLVMAMPYLGIARDGQVEPSAWGPGPAGGLIEGLDAVTLIVSESVSSQNIDGAGVLFDETFTPLLDGVVEVSFTASLSADLITSGGVSKAWCGFTAQVWENHPTTLLDQVSQRVIGWESGAVGVTRHAQAAAAMTADVTAGVPYRVIVQANEDALKFDNMVANDARLRATIVYR